MCPLYGGGRKVVLHEREVTAFHVGALWQRPLQSVFDDCGSGLPDALFFGLRIFYVLALALLVYAYYRMFSKDLSKRSAENQWYLKKEMKVRGWWQRKKRLLPVVRSTRSINARNADRRFGYPDIRGRSQSGAENAVKNLSARPDGKILWQDHGK